jgi:hypothetical protein
MEDSLQQPKGHMSTLRLAISSPLTVVGIAFLALSFGLLVQPDRFTKTPAYANLLVVLPQSIWGAIYLAVGLLIGASVLLRRKRALTVVAHTLSFSLASAWLLGFIIRYSTDSATTIVNVVSWAVLLYLIILSMLELDDWASG